MSVISMLALAAAGLAGGYAVLEAVTAWAGLAKATKRAAHAKAELAERLESESSEVAGRRIVELLPGHESAHPANEASPSEDQRAGENLDEAESSAAGGEQRSFVFDEASQGTLQVLSSLARHFEETDVHGGTLEFRSSGGGTEFRARFGSSGEVAELMSRPDDRSNVASKPSVIVSWSMGQIYDHEVRPAVTEFKRYVENGMFHCLVSGGGHDLEFGRSLELIKRSGRLRKIQSDQLGYWLPYLGGNLRVKKSGAEPSDGQSVEVAKPSDSEKPAGTARPGARDE